MQNKKLVLGSLLTLIILFMGSAFFYKSSETKKEEVAVSSRADSLIAEHSIKLGENKKNISIVEFLDPECESCALFHPIIRKLYKEYHEDIQIVTRYLANHKNSKFAIKILEASREQGKYEEVLEYCNYVLG